MNIFFDPAAQTHDGFAHLGDCLSLHREGLNEALEKLKRKLPERDRRFYHPLRLGGIVRGLPPYEDGGYLKAIEAVWGATLPIKALPEQGQLTLHPGQSATGSINGKRVTIYLNGSGAATLLIDGNAKDPSILSDRSGWQLPGGVCSNNTDHCGRIINALGEDFDRDQTFDIEPRFAENIPGAPH